MTHIHGTGVVFEGAGLLIMGPSGSGKSDLALRLISRGAELVGDDYVNLTKNTDNEVIMQTIQSIAGKIEVRNVGLLEVPYQTEAPVNFILKLCLLEEKGHLERLPERQTMTLLDCEIPYLIFNAFDCSAPEKVRAAIKILS